jgi:hypothetical protein
VTEDQSPAQDGMDPPVAGDRWPQQPPKHREVYGFMDPQWHVQMVALTAESWADISRRVAKMKTQLDALQEENIKMKQGLHVEGPRIVLPS